MKYTIAKSRYKSIKDRSFETFIDLFLIRSYLDDSSLQNATLQAFKSFNYDDSRIKECLEAYQLGASATKFNGKPVNELDEVITNWYNFADLELFKSCFTANRLIEEQEFLAFYGDDNKERACIWCGINENKIDLLIVNKLIDTKRLSTRGRKMEVDRLRPNEGYVEGNIALCCYWCNNAKTDEFDEDEFIPIGNAIGEVFRKRLKSIK